MYVTVQCDESLIIGDVVSFNELNQKWQKATTLTEEISVVKTSPNLDEVNNIYTCKIIVSGSARVFAAQDIPIQGGQLNVSDGKVFVDNSLVESPGFIVPKDINETDRLINSEVVIVIR